MRSLPFFKPALFAAVQLLLCSFIHAQDNHLTNKEKNDGWQLLFDGTSITKWKSAAADSFPSKGWAVIDNMLVIEDGEGHPTGGDIITREQYKDFELTVDFKLSEGANSGIKYGVHIYNPAIPGLGTVIGPEYQLLDDDKHPDAKAGINGNRKLGSLYDILPSSTVKALRPIGQWNTARIVSKGNHIEHFLNGIKVLEYDNSSERYSNAFAQSKFKSVTDFGKTGSGHILLQDHGHKIFFKNIKIRKL
ncbi:MAG: DUF1080 domain-containing protein [Chitinophagaceae bacterium]